MKREPRKKFLDYDARRTPKTAFSCVMCQRDLDPTDRKVRWVHLVDDVLVLHPADESLYTADERDRGTFPIGPDCAKKLGRAWTVDGDHALLEDEPAAQKPCKHPEHRLGTHGRLKSNQCVCMTCGAVVLVRRRG